MSLLSELFFIAVFVLGISMAGGFVFGVISEILKSIFGNEI
jgi:hypothetical protein